MNATLKKKANTVFYFLTKNSARDSFNQFLEDCDCSGDEWEEIKKEITDSTGIEFKYL